MAILWLAKRHKTITAEPDLAMMRVVFAGTEANMNCLDVLAYVLVALIGASAVASGQWVRYPTEGIPRKPDGKPMDAYSRWCGRGWWVTAAPMPIRPDFFSSSELAFL